MFKRAEPHEYVAAFGERLEDAAGVVGGVGDHGNAIAAATGKILHVLPHQ